MGTTCIDVDECDGDSSLAHYSDINSKSANTSGSYICYCNLGWESDNYGQVDTVCGDVDECDAGLSIDHAFDTNSACSDTYGIYDCFCDLDENQTTMVIQILSVSMNAIQIQV